MGIELRLKKTSWVCFWEIAGVIASELGTYSIEGAWTGRGKREAVQGGSGVYSGKRVWDRG